MIVLRLYIINALKCLLGSEANQRKKIKKSNLINYIF